MTSYFGFPASAELASSSLTLMQNFERGVSESQSALFVKVAQLFSDEIVNTLLLNIVRNAGPGQSSAGMLEQFAGLIKSTVHSLIKQVLGKMSNAELSPLASYIRERRQVFQRDGQEQVYIAFTLPDDFYDRFRRVLEQGAHGERNPDELLACMSEFHERAFNAFYDQSLEQIKLGFIGRKVADVGGAAIRKGSQSTSKKAVPQLQGVELKRFSAYFLGMLLRT